MSEFSTLLARIDEVAAEVRTLAEALSTCKAVCDYEREGKVRRASWARSVLTNVVAATCGAGIAYLLQR